MCDLIFAPATPLVVSPIIIVRASGKGLFKFLKDHFHPASGTFRPPQKGYSVHFGKLTDEEGKVIDHCMIFAAPPRKSYTGEEYCEFHLHGNPRIAEDLFNLLKLHGGRYAERGEFTLRGFLNGKFDLLKAESILVITESTSRKAREAAFRCYEGKLSDWVSKIQKRLTSLLASIEVQFDYAEDLTDAPEEVKNLERALEELKEELKRALSAYSETKIYREGALVVIAGAPNAGKSSLLNLLLKRERAIVSPHPGTTRDYLEEKIVLGDVPVILVDTAGFRKNPAVLEKIGVEKGKELLEAADLVLVLVDSTKYPTPEDEEVLKITKGKNRLLLANKVDLTRGKHPEGFLPISAKTGQNLSLLLEEMRKRLTGTSLMGSEVWLLSEREKSSVERALQHINDAILNLKNGTPEDLIAIDIRNALEALGDLNPAEAGEEVLKEIFSKFCVGK